MGTIKFGNLENLIFFLNKELKCFDEGNNFRVQCSGEDTGIYSGVLHICYKDYDHINPSKHHKTKLKPNALSLISQYFNIPKKEIYVHLKESYEKYKRIIKKTRIHKIKILY